MRIIIYLLLFYLCYRAVRSWLMRNFAQPAQTEGRTENQVDDLMVKDPNCGIYFPKREGIPLKKANQEHFFCSKKCRNEYLDRLDREQ